MASLVYILSEIFKQFPTQTLRGTTPSSNTLQQYKQNSINYAKWAKKRYPIQSFKSCGNHIQAYADYLAMQGKSAATIHSYIAGCCHTWGIPISDIKKPHRRVHMVTRSRGTKAVDKRRDARREGSPRLFDFAQVVGIRRHEYLRLRKDNLTRDESGYLCVEVKKGKGGKYQLQRILPQHEEAVKAYFDGSGDFVFTKNEMRNKLDLHHMRAEVSQNAYDYYVHRISTEPGYARQLAQELMNRWYLYNKKRTWDPSLIKDRYTIRGENRRRAISLNLPTSYNRLAVMAVSVFHLSHWRCDVTVDNYLLAR